MNLILALALMQGSDDAEVARMYAEKGAAALKASKLDEARLHYEKALERDATHVGAHDGLATVLQKQGDVEGAVDHWRRARTLLELRESLSMDERKQLGDIKSQLKKYDEVAGEFRKVADTLMGLGEKWMRKKMYASARRAYEQALSLDPDNEEARKSLAKIDELTDAGWTDLLTAGAAWTILLGKDVKRAEAPRGRGHPAAERARPIIEKPGDVVRCIVRGHGVEVAVPVEVAQRNADDARSIGGGRDSRREGPAARVPHGGDAI